MPKTDLVLIKQMLDLISEIDFFVSGFTILKFIEDNKTIKAVAINIQFLGEAANQLSTESTNNHHEIPWKKIIGLRHKIVHHYLSIDPETLWDITQKDLPRLKQQLLPILDDLEAQEKSSTHQ